MGDRAPGSGEAPWESDRRLWNEQRLCRGCEDDGTCQLGVSIGDADSGACEGTVRFGAEHQGGTGIAHGGWVAAAFDEVLGIVTEPQDTVTRHLQVRYRRPVPVGEILHLRARLVSSEGRERHCEGELSSGAGELLASGKALYVEVGEDVQRWRHGSVAGVAPGEERG